MSFYLIPLFFLLGAIIASFLSVIAGRFGTGETVVWGRSKCLLCKRNIAWYDLVPILSYLALRGRCRSCKKPIGRQYLLLELILGTLFAGFYLRFSGVADGANIYLFFLLYLDVIAVLTVIFVIDAKTYLIPDTIVLPGIAIYLSCAVIAILGAYDYLIYQPTWINLALGIAIGAGLFLVLVVGTKGRGMGWGDVKLGALLGIVLGYPLILVSLFFSFVIGSFWAVTLMMLKKKTLKDALPFGPFLVIGALVAVFFGKYIIGWYVGM